MALVLLAFTADGKVLVDANGIGDAQAIDAGTGEVLRSVHRSKVAGDGRPRAVGNQTWLTTGLLSPSARYYLVDDRGTKAVTLVDLRSGAEASPSGAGVFTVDGRSMIIDGRLYEPETKTWGLALP